MKMNSLCDDIDKEMRNMKRYCECCAKEVNAKIITKIEHYKILGDEIVVKARVLICPYCGEEFFCEKLDNETLNEAYDEYRKRHKLLLPEEIRNIREMYGLSQRGFAKLLNWGDKTLFRYESGSIQDKAHNSLFILLRNPENMRTYLNDNEITINENQKKKLLERIDKLERKSAASSENHYISSMFAYEPSINNGFKSFDYDKFCAMVLFFAKKSRKLLKVKLLKLLNYSDMFFYKEYGTSISGTEYVHLPYGPVPQNFTLLFGLMEKDGIIRVEVDTGENGYEKHVIKPVAAFNKGMLTDAEVCVLESVYEKFKKYGSSAISEYSHKEKGYCSTRQGEIISYEYAKELNL